MLSRIVLPPVPPDQRDAAVAGWREPVVIDTYAPEAPDRYPAFLETRVYQGSSGQVYPLPFFERIGRTKAPHAWDAVHLENAWVRLMVLPELGGRIHVAVDRTNGYDFFYRNNVIKPALVGLAGPWISGGVEFNWPQHHRPATYLPADCVIEHEGDGSVTVWCSDHEPFHRMKGMHGIRLRPDSNVIEARVRVFNRSDDVQTFLWWSNVAVSVNEDYQSFFPTDVHHVADHAKRAIATFPRVDGRYYGIDYPARVGPEHPDADRIDWYRNIPVPTSYMCLTTADDFFGGYDHSRDAGFVYWADHRIAPGKKQWTWGNSAFGQAWDRQLTDDDGPYVELMAGAFTDNQPDFAFLAPGETKAFSQFWYPIQRIGPAHQATVDAAVAFRVEPADGTTTVRVGVAVTGERAGAVVRVVDDTGTVLIEESRDLAPQAPLVLERELVGHLEPHRLEVVVVHGGRVLVRWRPRPPEHRAAPPEPVRPLPGPEGIETVEELYLTARHLEQYRHATRSPEPYLLEAIRRDPGDSRSATMLAARRHRTGQYAEAERWARVAIDRLTRHNPNPYDGEAHYRRGLALIRLGLGDEARDAFAKASWDTSWAVPATLELARADARDGRWTEALARLDGVVARDGRHLQARDLRVIALRELGDVSGAQQQLAANVADEPLDWWAADLAGKELTTDPQTCLDVALEYLAVGRWADAARVAGLAATRQADHPNPGINNAAPIAHYYRARALRELDEHDAALAALTEARACDATNCLAGRLQDADLLVDVLAAGDDDARAHALLGHWLYHQGRREAAREHWLRATALDPTDDVSWRNLAVAAFNVDRDPETAEGYYAQALAACPLDPKLWYERDQLAKRRGRSPHERLAVLRSRPGVVAQRDDLSVELAELLTLTGRPADAIELISARRFGPWEGGEGQVLGAWDHAHLALAREALALGRPQQASDALRAALAPPENLGEDRHPLANCADLWLAMGDARAAEGAVDEAEGWWRRAAEFQGDFQGMKDVPYSGMTYYSALAWRALGEVDRCDELRRGMAAHADELERTEPEIDYFATSLPTMLLFHDDLAARRDNEVLLLRAQVMALLGDESQARAGVEELLRRDPSHVRAHIWWRHQPAAAV